MTKLSTAARRTCTQRLEDEVRKAYQVVTDKLLSKLKRAGGDVDQILQLGLQTGQSTHQTTRPAVWIRQAAS